MKKLYILITTLALVLWSASVFASAEGILRLDAFQLTSEGIGESGPVTIKGIQGDNGISKLTIIAFGKQFELNNEQLSKVQGLVVNGLQPTSPRFE